MQTRILRPTANGIRKKQRKKDFSMNLKKVLAVILAICMVYSTMGVSVFAAPSAFTVDTSMDSNFVAEIPEEDSFEADLNEEALPTATATKISENGLTHAVRFGGNKVDGYTNWKLNIELTSNYDMTLEYNNNAASGHLSVFTDKTDWRDLPQNDNMFGAVMGAIELKAGEPVKVMDCFLTDYLGLNNLTLGYDDLFGDYSGLACGLKLTDAFLADKSDLYVEFKLYMYIPNGEVHTLATYSFGEKPTSVNVGSLAALQAALADTTNDLPVLITEAITIPVGEVVTLDLNGKTVNSVFNGSSTTNHIYALTNNGTLEIKDTVGEGSINTRGIHNYGTLTLTSGTINSIDGNGGYAVNNQSGSTFVMNGGVVATTYEDDNMSSSGGYDATSINVYSGATATLNGGKIVNVCDFTFAVSSAGTLNIPEDSTIEIEGTHGAIAVSGGKTTINAGTFSIPEDDYLRTDNVIYVSGGAIEINGGTFIGDSDTAAGGTCVSDAAGTAVINGGSFSGSSGGDVNGTTGTTINGGTFENLIETKHVTVGSTITNGGKKYTKTESGLEEVVPDAAKIGDASYATFAEALAAVKATAGNEIVLLSDVVVNGQNALDALTGDTLDLNGHSLTVSGNSYFKDGTTTFKNSVTTFSRAATAGTIVVTGYASDAYFCCYTAGAKVVFDGVTVTGDNYKTGCAVFNANAGEIVIKNSAITLSGDTEGGVIYGGKTTIDNTTIDATDVARGITNSVAEIKNGTEFTFDGGETGLNNSSVTIDDSEVLIKNATKRAVRLGDNALTLQNGATLTADNCAEDIVPYNASSNPTVNVDATSNLNAVNNIIEGSGTEADPYLIKSLDNLKKFRDNVNAGDTYAGKYIKVVAAEIDLEDAEWTPIGTSSKAFKGHFDGNGVVIKNLVVTGGTGSDKGFFGFTTDGSVKNLTIENAKVSGRLNVGVVAGTPYTTTYSDITVKGHVEVSGMAYVGGVGGKNAYANWTDITVDVDATSFVKADSIEGGNSYRTYVGGVIGFMGEGNHTVKNVTSNINVIGSVCDIGGIVGIAHYGNKFENVTCSGSVTNTTTDEENLTETGAIAGVWHNEKNQTVTFTGCTYTGPSTTLGLVGAAYTVSNDEACNSGNLIIDGEKEWPVEAKIGGEYYKTLEAAVAAVQAGETIKILSDVTLEAELELPAGILFDGNGYQINGTIYAGGDLEFVGHTKVTAFSASYYDRVITIGAGACLEVTGTGRVTLGYGNTFNITGTIADAKTADKATVTPSLIIPGGMSVTGGNDAAMNVKNAYVKIGSTSSKNNAANGTFTFDFDNSVVEFTNQFTFAEPTSGKNPTFNVNIKDSVLTTGTKFVVAAPNTEVVVDNSVVTLATYFRNSGKFTLKNGSVLTGATIQFGENGGNNGEIVVDASTITITAGNTASALDGKGTGSVTLTNGAKANIDYSKDMVFNIDATSELTAKGVVGSINLDTSKLAVNDSKKVVIGPEALKDIVVLDDVNIVLTYADGAVTIKNDGTIKALNGEGTEVNPYLIRNIEDLKFFRDSVNRDEPKYNAEGVYVALDADIDMAGEDWSVNIGDDCATQFVGIFDGKGHTLSNLTATETAQKSDGFICTGLFGATYGPAVIKNLTINNATITAPFKGNNVGVVVGMAYSCTASIENVKVTGDIKIDAPEAYGVGAVVGYVYYGDLNIKNCSVEANDGSYIKASSGAGAIVGYGADAMITNVTVKNIDIEALGLVAGVAGLMFHGNGGFIDTAVVEDVNLTATKAQWVNSKAVALGTIAGNPVTVKNITATNVNVDRLVGSAYAEQPTEVVPAVAAKIGDNYYTTLGAAFAAVKDGETITVLSDVTIDESTRMSSGGTWYEGIYYVGDQSFTVDLNGYKVTNTSAVNDYLVLLKNTGSKANEITFKNGTLEAASGAYCAICTSTTSTQQITINLEDVNAISGNSDGSVIKVRGGAVLNVKDGTVITGKNSYLGIENANAVVNIYEGAEIYQKGTSSYNGCLVGVCANGTVNVYGGYGESVSGGFIAMTSGGTINVYGGEWIANTDGTYANSNKSVLIAQSDKNTYPSAGVSAVNVYDGIFAGGYNCYGNAAGDAEINISGGIFSADPAAYVESGYKAYENNVDDTYFVAKTRSVNISADSTNVLTNGTVEISVSVHGEDLANAEWTINYETAKFTLVGGDNTGVINDKVFKTDNSVYTDGEVVKTYTFAAVAQDTDDVLADFVISNTVAYTHNESYNSTNIVAENNEKVTVEIDRIQYVVSATFDGVTLTPDANGDFVIDNFVYDEADHTFVVTTDPSATVSYTVNGDDVNNVVVKSAGDYTITYTVQNPTGYAPASGSVSFTIEKATFADVKVTFDNNEVVNNVVDPFKFDNADHRFEVTTTTPGATVSYTVNGTAANEVVIRNVGEYTITYKIEKESYTTVEGTLTIVVENAEYVVEVNVVDDADYVNDYKLVLVYTNTANVSFKYGRNEMVDVTAKGYVYDPNNGSGVFAYDANTTKVFAFVVNAIDGADLSDYEALITPVYDDATVSSLEGEVALDINLDGTHDIRDITSAFGVLNVDETLFTNTRYQRLILAADTNNNKNVDIIDVTDVIYKVYPEDKPQDNTNNA